MSVGLVLAVDPAGQVVAARHDRRVRGIAQGGEPAQRIVAVVDDGAGGVRQAGAPAGGIVGVLQPAAPGYSTRVKRSALSKEKVVTPSGAGHGLGPAKGVVGDGLGVPSWSRCSWPPRGSRACGPGAW